jgi:hypothetical protein
MGLKGKGRSVFKAMLNCRISVKYHEFLVIN